MMTQSVMTQAAKLFGNASGSVTSKGKQKGTGFDLLIDRSMNSTESVDNSKISSPKDKQISDASDRNASRVSEDESNKSSEMKADLAEERKASHDVKSKARTENKAVEAENTHETQDKKLEKRDETGMEELMAQLNSLLQSIRQLIMDKLELTSEELDELLAKQQMGIMDLLQSENLQELILASQGATDIFSVLTDESLGATMKDLLAEVEAAKQAADLSLSREQMEKLLEQLKEQVSLQEAAIEEGEETKAPGNFEAVAEQEQEEETDLTGASRNKQAVTEAVNQKDGTSNILRGADATKDETYAGTEKEDRDQDLGDMKQFQMFVENLTKASTSNQVDFSGNIVQVTELRDIANQIIERIKVTITPDNASMELQLNPEHLGKVNLTVQSKNGVMTAQFVVQNEISKEAIESQLQTLRDTLTQQGIKVEAIEVTVAAYEFEQNTGEGANNQQGEEKKDAGKKITLEEAMNMTEAPEEAWVADITGITGSQIDYTA